MRDVDAERIAEFRFGRSSAALGAQGWPGVRGVRPSRHCRAAKPGHSRWRRPASPSSASWLVAPSESPLRKPPVDRPPPSALSDQRRGCPARAQAFPVCQTGQMFRRRAAMDGRLGSEFSTCGRFRLIVRFAELTRFLRQGYLGPRTRVPDSLGKRSSTHDFSSRSGTQPSGPGIGWRAGRGQSAVAGQGCDCGHGGGLSRAGAG